MSVVPRGLQIGEGPGSIVAGEFDQGAVVMDHAAGFASRGRGERPAEVDGGFGVTTRRIVEDAAVQCGTGKPVVALKRARVIAQGLVIPTKCLVGQSPVVVALGRVVGQRDADTEGVDSVFEPAELVSAEPLVEVRPEVLRPEVDGLLELVGGAASSPSRR